MADASTRAAGASTTPVAASSAPPALDTPEFRAAVARAVEAALPAAVATALAGAAVPLPEVTAPAVVGLPQPVVIQPTSIDTSKPGLDDLTVRFNRFCTFQGHGYQRGQDAGFPRKAAEDLQRSGAAFIVHDPRRDRRAA